MRILMAMQSLAMGGAEKFFTTLANALNERHSVTCYIPAIQCGDPAMIRRLGPVAEEHISWFTPLIYRVFYKLTLMIRQHSPNFDPETVLHTRNLLRLHAKHRFDIVNAQLMPSTRQVCRAFEFSRLAITKSDHGDTASATDSDASVLHRLDALICPAEANALRARNYPLRPDCRLVTIPYGHQGQTGAATALPPFDGITFGLLARGVADKGWEEAIEALRMIRSRLKQEVRLIFVGDGPFLQALRSRTHESWVIFAGQQSAPESWVRSFDVGLLPSCLAEESLPNSIIEYLASGKPVIATDIGGISEMITTREGMAGILIQRDATGRADILSLSEAMLATASKPEFRLQLAQRTALAFQRFSLPECVNAYERLFSELIHRAA